MLCFSTGKIPRNLKLSTFIRPAWAPGPKVNPKAVLAVKMAEN